MCVMDVRLFRKNPSLVVVVEKPSAGRTNSLESALFYGISSPGLRYFFTWRKTTLLAYSSGHETGLCENFLSEFGYTPDMHRLELFENVSLGLTPSLPSPSPCSPSPSPSPPVSMLSQVIHLLQLLLAKHPAMKAVVVREVQQYLHRPGLQPKATYAGVIFLNQVTMVLVGGVR